MAELWGRLAQDYPKFLERLTHHNEEMQALKVDIRLFQQNHLTPREAFIELCKALRLRGAKMTGQEYASSSANKSLKQFFYYFSALPERLQESIKNLGDGRRTFRAIFDEEIEKGSCIETTANDIEAILQANQPSPLLDSTPQLAPEALQALRKKYRVEPSAYGPARNNLVTEPSEHFLPPDALPKNRLKHVLAFFQPETPEDLIIMLLALPSELYDSLWENMTLRNPSNVLPELAESINLGFFDGIPAQKAALAQAIALNFPQFSHLSYLHWAAQIEEPLFIQAGLENIPEEERLAAVKEKDNKGRAVLHLAAANSDALERILNLYPEEERLTAVKEKDNTGKTVLHLAARNSDAIEMILKLLPEEKRLKPVKEHLLHWAGVNPGALERIFKLLTEEERLAAVREKIHNGGTVLHLVVDIPGLLERILNLLPEEKRLAVLKEKDDIGHTVLRYTALRLCLLQEIVGLIPESQRLALLKTEVAGHDLWTRLKDVDIKDSFTQTCLLIFRAVNQPHSLLSFFTSYFTSQNETNRLKQALKDADSFDAVKEAVLEFLSDENGRTSRVGQALLNALTPNVADGFRLLLLNIKWNSSIEASRP